MLNGCRLHHCLVLFDKLDEFSEPRESVLDVADQDVEGASGSPQAQLEGPRVSHDGLGPEELIDVLSQIVVNQFYELCIFPLIIVQIVLEKTKFEAYLVFYLIINIDLVGNARFSFVHSSLLKIDQ